MGPAPINFVTTDDILNISMTEILSFYRIKNLLHFSNYYWFNTYCVIVRIISITSIVTLPIRTVLPNMRVGRALVCIVARRNRSHTLIARVYKPDIPPKCTEMVWLGILNTQIQFKKIRQFSRWWWWNLSGVHQVARGKSRVSQPNGAKRKPIRENPNIF